MINIIAILTVILFSIRITERKKSFSPWIWASIFGIINLFLLPYAYSNSLPEVIRQIQTGVWADNFVLVVSLDVLMGMILCFRSFQKSEGKKINKRWIEYLPPLLLIPVQYYLNATFFYAFPTLKYNTAGLILLFLITTGFPFTGYLCRWILKDQYAIIEFRAIITLLIFIVILTYPLLHLNKPAYSAPLHLNSLGFIFLLFVTGFGLGYIVFKVKKFYFQKIKK